MSRNDAANQPYAERARWAERARRPSRPCSEARGHDGRWSTYPAAEAAGVGLYTGALSCVSGLIVLIGSSVTGSRLDLDLIPAVPWLVLAAVPTLVLQQYFVA
ncbi:hypothetical protein E4N62_20910 [Streptomyces sp. MNU76]|nr:hypothetical protein [Streptomyces sp. MNU76]MCC9707521.1 hypothetical protein [Streptomyces sp. MNU76]